MTGVGGLLPRARLRNDEVATMVAKLFKDPGAQGDATANQSMGGAVAAPRPIGAPSVRTVQIALGLIKWVRHL